MEPDTAVYQETITRLMIVHREMKQGEILENSTLALFCLSCLKIPQRAKISPNPFLALSPLITVLKVKKY